MAHKEKVYNSRYPLKTFLLLVDPSLSAEVLAETCQWDQWTTSFCNTYLGQGIDSPSALADLRSIALMLKLDTSQLESMHATLRRVCVLAGCQTHAEAFLDASAEHVLRTVRRISSRVKPLWEGPRAKEASSTDAGDAREMDKHQAKRRGGGGAWRAFVALHAGSTEGNDFAHLATLYRNLADDEREELQRLGADATIKHRRGVAHPFGPNKRQRLRNEHAMLKSNTIAALSTGCVEDEEALVRAFHVADAIPFETGNASDPSSPWTRVLAVRALATVQEKARAATMKRNAQQIADYEFGDGKRQLELLGEGFVALSKRLGDFRTIAGSETQGGLKHHAFSWIPVRPYVRAGELASIPASTAVGRVAFSKLQQLWHRLRQRVPSTHCPVFDAERRGSKASACLRAAMCVCRKSGRQHLPLMERNLRKAFRSFVEEHAAAKAAKAMAGGGGGVAS